MDIIIKSEAIEDMINHLEEYKEDSKKIKSLIDNMSWHIRYHNNRFSNNDYGFTIYLDDFDVPDLERINLVLKAIKARAFVKKVSALIAAISSPEETIIPSLEMMPRLIKEYMIKNTEHKWVFRSEDNSIIPYFVYNIFYEPAHKDKDYYYEPRCTMELHTNHMAGYKKLLITFYNGDIANKPISIAMKDMGLLFETKELYKEYEKSDKIFQDKIKEIGKQYKATKFVTTEKSYGYSRTVTCSKNDVVKFHKVVNYSRSDNRSIKRSEDCSFWGRRTKTFSSECSNYNNCYDLPVLPYIRCYNIDIYSECYCHIDDIEDYVYDHSLRNKLVLPESHKALLDILVSKNNILKGDIINNKGNGSIIILEGPPGCGKTLTTEVYSELIEKPLLKVSSGQLGVDANKIDSSLNEMLRIAESLDCILLIDECEIFVKKRGDDLEQNAIVATFLRRLEYFNGILFLTSNRIKDVDEAILSRCIAAIRYNEPTKENAKKIWRVLADQFDLSDSITDNLISDLVEIFPHAVGRDIKELLKLTSRYCEGLNEEISIKAFLDCAQFRYIDINDKKVEEINKR